VTADLLTPWETFLVTMPIADYLELNPCECEALCVCEEADE
jgi:hypothetical protein